MSKKEECPRRTSHSRIMGLSVILAAVMLTASLGWAGPWFSRRGPRHNPELARDHIDFMVGRALSNVDATEEQEEAIDAIIDRAFADHLKMRGDHEADRAEVISILTAEKIDRDRLEVFRAKKVTHIQEMSFKIADTVADIGDVLTPEQRLELAEWARERFE